MKQTILIFLVLSAITLMAVSPQFSPQYYSPKARKPVPTINLGPAYFYPANPSKRIYRLPYSTGKTFEMTDGYFSDPAGHPSWSDHPDYSLDFRMPEGEPIRCVRAGKVLKLSVRDSLCNIPGHNPNHVVIGRMDSLPDGRKVMVREWYEHIRHDVPVRMGQWVEQGEIIAFNSCTGWNGGGPHLHFEVDMEGHEGRSDTLLGGDNRPITTIPTPFVEVGEHDGLPELGEKWTSQNGR